MTEVVMEFFHRYDCGFRGDIQQWCFKNKKEEIKERKIKRFERWREKMECPISDKERDSYIERVLSDFNLREMITSSLTLLSMKKKIWYDKTTSIWFLSNDDSKDILLTQSKIKELQDKHKKLVDEYKSKHPHLGLGVQEIDEEKAEKKRKKYEEILGKCY